jgi:hypothetical protein
MFYPCMIQVLIPFSRGDTTNPFRDYIPEGLYPRVWWEWCSRSKRLCSWSIVVDARWGHAYKCSRPGSAASFILRMDGGRIRVQRGDTEFCSWLFSAGARRWNKLHRFISLFTLPHTPFALDVTRFHRWL